MQRLTNIQLRQIALNCESLEELQYEIPMELYESFISSCQSVSIQGINGKSHALIKAITGISTPLDMSGYVTGYSLELALLGSAALPILIIILSVGTCLGGYRFYNTYQKKKIEKEETIHFFQLYELKSRAFDELIAREKTKINKVPLDYTLDEKKASNESLARLFHHAKNQPSHTKAFVTGFIPAAALSYAGWSAATYFETLGYITISASLATPLGLAIVICATAIAIGIGGYLGYKHYQSQRAQLSINHRKQEISHNLTEKKQTYESLVQQRNKIETRKFIDETIHARHIKHIHGRHSVLPKHYSIVGLSLLTRTQ